jgi:hypothetical protein
MNNLGLVLNNQGKYDRADETHQQALTLREKMLGLEHPDTSTSVNCLTHLFHSQKQHEATVLYEQACAKSLGPQHPITISCLKHYSSMLEEMERV